MCKESMNFSELSVNRFFEIDGKSFLKVSSFEVNGEARNAVSSDEKYIFVQDNAQVLVKKRADK